MPNPDTGGVQSSEEYIGVLEGPLQNWKYGFVLWVLELFKTIEEKLFWMQIPRAEIYVPLEGPGAKGVYDKQKLTK